MKRLLLIVLFITGVCFAQKYEGMEFYPNGKPNFFKTYKVSKGKIEIVKEVGWHQNGQKKSEGAYKDGEKDGLFTIWYLSGDNKKTKMYYKKNVLHGSHKRYNKKDEVTYHVIYIDDLPEIFVFGDFYDPQSYPKWESSIDKSLKHLKDLLNDGFINEEDYILFKIDLLKDEKYWNEDGSVKE